MRPSPVLLRMALREVMRSKGRSILIVLMILAPVLVMTLIDVTARSATLETPERMQRQLGDADMRVRWLGSGEIRQNAYGEYDIATSDPGNHVEPRGAAVSPDIPALLSNAEIAVEQFTGVTVRTPNGIGLLSFRMVDYEGPIADDLLVQTSGHAPRNKDEVVLTKGAADRLDKRIGDKVEVTKPEQRTFTVVGMVEDPSSLRADMIVGDPGAFTTSEEAFFGVNYYANVNEPISWERVQEFNKLGVLVESKALAASPPPGSDFKIGDGGELDSGTISALVLVGGLATLEICLLAGTAFAVGTRRQRRSLALLAATGGTQRQMRDVVLSMSIVLGAVASTVGALLGIGFVAAGQPLLEWLGNARFGDFDIEALDIAVIVATGVLAAVLSALVPARVAGRMDVVAALNGRRDAQVGNRHWRLPIVGGLLLTMGIGLALLGAQRRDLDVLLIASASAEIGLVMCTSLIVGFFGRVAGRLPFGPRLALRDAVRNRSRTAPVVAAIMAAVAGAFSVSMYASTYDVNDREDYVAEIAKGQATLSIDPTTDRVDELKALLSNTLPTTQIGTQWAATAPTCGTNERTCFRSFQIERAEPDRCPFDDTPDPVGALPRDIRTYATDPRCDFATNRYFAFNEIVVGDADFARTLFPSNAQQAAELLEAGGVVLASDLDVRDGNTTVALVEDGDGRDGSRHLSRTQLPAASFDTPERTATARAVISRATATQLGMTVEGPIRLQVGTERMPTEAEEDRTRDALSRTGSLDYFDVERGYQSPYGIGLLVLAAATAVLALLATGVAAGLALADGQADQATLAAVGAGPRIRRVSSAFQAFVISILGVLLGIVAGTIPGAGFAWQARYEELPLGVQVHRGVPWLDVIPWTTGALLLLGVPVTAAAFAWLLTRSRIPMTRRGA